jgi:palmitoyltransferase
MIAVDPKQVEQLAMMAAKLDPEKIKEYNAQMELQLQERMKQMTPEALQNLQTVKQFVTDKTVDVLTNKTVSAPPEFDLETKMDQDLLNALRYSDLGVFVGLFLQQNRTSASEIRFHSDPKSHPLLHWAALDDRLDVIQYLCAQVKVNVNAQNANGETALHWACIKGHTRSIHMLTSFFHAKVDLVDNKGYSLLHVAAQNGHAFTIAQLNRKGLLDVDCRDNAGRTPLHWASYRGYESVVRWLLSHGADPDAEDDEKCCAIHWAANRSHVDIVQILVQLGDSGSKLFANDTTGKTPKMLAQGKLEQAQQQSDPILVAQYQRVIAYCNLWEERQTLIDRNFGKPTWRMRVSGKLPHFSYFLWPVLAPIGFHQYATVLLPATSQYSILHLVFLIAYFSKWFFWTRLQTKDPGDYVVPVGKPGSVLGYGSLSPTWGWRHNGWPDFTRRLRNRDTREEATVPNANLVGASKHRELYHRALDEGLLVPVCMTCEIVKPVRAKHDAVSNMCVQKFDHFCPWMNSCIGQKNYLDFFLTALSATIAMWIWTFFIFIYTRDYTLGSDTVTFVENMSKIGFTWQAFAWFYALLAVYASMMLGQHIHLASLNQSTNEMISGARYRYLVEDGKRGNPFHRGVFFNFLELFGLIDELKGINLEEYHADALKFGNFPKPVPEPMMGSPWYRKAQTGGGHSHANGEHHGHSH